MDCVERATQSVTLLNLFLPLFLNWHADETGLPRRSAGGGGFFSYTKWHYVLHRVTRSFFEVVCVA